MPRRRIHTKSPYGCDQCKKRRVKCDEQHPICTSCATREERCHYSKRRRPIPSLSEPHQLRTKSSLQLPLALSALSDTKTPSSKSASPDAHNSPSQLQQPDPSHSTIRKRELKLMHFWFTKTSQSFTNDLGKLFQNEVVKLAIEHDYLHDFIFALTALHIASEKVNSDAAVASEYVAVALRYQSNGFPKFRTALCDITEENCNAIFFSSVLTMICCMVSHSLVGEKDETKGLKSFSRSSSTGCIFSLYHFISGIDSVHKISLQWLESGPFGQISKRRKCLGALLIESTEIAGAQLRRLNSVVNIDGIPNTSLYQVYEKAIQCMEKSFDKNLGMTWVNFAGEGFVNQLKQEEPMALAILMYWGLILSKMDEIWWAVLVGTGLAVEVTEILAGHGAQFDEVREWVRLELGVISE